MEKLSIPNAVTNENDTNSNIEQTTSKVSELTMLSHGERYHRSVGFTTNGILCIMQWGKWMRMMMGGVAVGIGGVIYWNCDTLWHPQNKTKHIMRSSKPARVDASYFKTPCNNQLFMSLSEGTTK